MGDVLADALEHARGGRAVFPLHFPVQPDCCSCDHGRRCGSIGKHPRDTGWQDDATTDAGEVRRLWKGRGRSNIGIATGERNGFFVLDIDPRHDGTESLYRLEKEHGKLPATVEALTGGGGQHLFFAWPDGGVPNRGPKNAIAPGIEVKGDGGLIVGVGSLHQSGRRYEWEGSSHPDEVGIAPAPGWLLELIRTEGERRQAAQETPVEIAEGKRNDTLASVAGKLRATGLTCKEILPTLRAINTERCRPPLDDHEVEGIAESICRYPPTRQRHLKFKTSTEIEIVDDEPLGITPIRVSRGDPVIYTVTIRGRGLRVTAEELVNFRLFKQRVLSELDFIPRVPFIPCEKDPRTPLPLGQAWDVFVNRALEELIEDEPAPEDASPRGAVWEAICEFLTEGKLSEDRDRLYTGQVIVEGDFYFFRGQDLRHRLRLTGCDQLGEHRLWLLVRDKGGKNDVVRTARGTCRVWKLPVTSIRPVESAVEDVREEPPSGLLL